MTTRYARKRCFTPFLFDGLAVRGEWLNITASWQAAKQHHPYPEAVMQLLGEALAAATLLSATIKFDGNLILQAQGNGSLKSLVAQSTNKREIRGWARCDDAVTGESLVELLGSGRLVLTIEPATGEPYQGIVPLTGTSLSEAVETYFSQSEQLKTRLWIFANQNQATALFIQELPAQQDEKLGKTGNALKHWQTPLASRNCYHFLVKRFYTAYLMKNKCACLAPNRLASNVAAPLKKLPQH